MQFAILTALLLVTFASGSKLEGDSKVKRALAFRPTIINIDPSFQAGVTEQVAINQQKDYIRRLSNTPGPGSPKIGDTLDDDDTVIFNSTVSFTLPAGILIGIEPSWKKILRDDPIRFRFLIRREAERLERIRNNELYDEDTRLTPTTLFEYAAMQEDQIIAFNKTTVSLPPAWQSALDLNNLLKPKTTSVTIPVASRTKIASAAATAGSILSVLLEEAASSNVLPTATSVASPGSYTFEKVTTTIEATMRVRKFVTTGWVIRSVAETGSVVPTSAPTRPGVGTVTGTKPLVTSTCTSGTTAIGATPTCGVGKVPIKIGALLVVMGLPLIL